VFTAITTVSSITFTNQVEAGIKRNRKLSLESAMREIISPLQRSASWVNQMAVMLEASPHKYKCDDGNISSLDGNASNAGFLYDAGMYALQRPTLRFIYQTRLSSRFTTPNGTKRPIVCLVSPPQTEAILFANGSRISANYAAGGSALEGIGTIPTTTSEVDIINLSFVREPVETVEPRWLSGPVTIRLGTNITILSVQRDNVETRFSYMVNITDPSDPTAKWAVGIDHNMKTLQVTLRQATPPVQLSLTATNESVSTITMVSGAHTSIYNMHEGVLMSSTHPDMPIVQSNGKMFSAGQTPVHEINRAYNAAIDLCGTSDCTNAEVVIQKESVQTVLRYNNPTSRLHLLLVTSVPRSYYFDDADRTFAIMLGLSVGSFVLVASGCLALLVLLHRPLSSLKRNMIEAAELHNDRVEHTSTYLRDIAQLSTVFDGMNQQLLIARSFVPEAVLLGKTEDSQEDVEDEGSVSGDVHTKSAHSRNFANEPSSATLDGTNASSNNSSNGMAKLFNVAEKRVGVLSLNLLGFHGLCAPERNVSRAQKINELSTDLLELAVACAHGERGVMDSFHGDHFTLTFNASRAVSGPLAAAVRTATAFIAGVSESTRYGGCGGVAAGAASGRAHVGTFGIDGYRRMSVVGEVYRTANMLQTAAVQLLRMNAGMRAGCMIEEAALKELGHGALHLQLTACLQSSAHRAQGGKTPAKAYFAHPVDQDEKTINAMKADGEWLYELDAIEATNPFLEPNLAMNALMEGNAALCGQLIDAHLAAAANTSPLGNSPRNRSGSMSLTMSDDGSFDLMEITQMDDYSPAWAFVRRQNRAMAIANTGEGGAEDATSNARCFRLPWVVFHQ
jgi:class 3 adenylate cyclase